MASISDVVERFLGFARLCAVLVLFIAGSEVYAQQVLVNTSFELGSYGWRASSPTIFTSKPAVLPANSGSNVAYLGGFPNANDQNNFLCQSIFLPPNANTLTVSFFYLVASEDTGNAANDNLFARIYDNSGSNIRADIARLSNLDRVRTSITWRNSTTTIAVPSGPIQLCFDGYTDGFANTNFFIDDVTVTYTLTPPVVVVPPVVIPPVVMLPPLQPIVIVTPNATNSAPVNRYRINIPSTSGHLYTTDENEYKVLTTTAPSIYIAEGVDHKIFKAAVVSGGQTAIPFFRLYIKSLRQHFWTSDRNEYLTLRESRDVFNDDGIDGYLFPTAGTPGSVPLFRLVLNNTAIHHWTTDENEFNYLRVRGWTPEGAPNNPLGVTGYVMPK
jgi:Repeat of unknown function (DUF5648)